MEKPETEVESVCMISPEKDFSLEDYVSKINKETSSLNFTTLVDSNKSNAGEKTFSEKDNRFRQRPIQSAKTSVCSISKTNLGIQNEFSSGLTRHKSDTRLKQGKAIDDFIPESVKGIGQEGMTRFLTAKVKALVDQMQVMQREEKKLTENLKGFCF